MIAILLIFLLTIFCNLALPAQQNIVYCDDIKTLRCEKSGRLTPLPVISLRGEDTFELSFDQMSHDARRFSYDIEHCDKDWNKDENLFLSEVFEGNSQGILIDKYRESQNTTVLYTHYSFSFPNLDVRPLISGNYRIKIFDESSAERRLVASVSCLVVDPLTSIHGKISSDTDLDYYGAHQQLTLSVDVTPAQCDDIQQEIFCYVSQNHRLDQQVQLHKTNRVFGTTLIWEHEKSLIFSGGNEYRHFEQLSMKQAGYGIEKIDWFAPYYHTTLDIDLPRRNYLHVEDQNGDAVIRTTDNVDNYTESDYSFVHFTLKMPRIDSDIFINGQWTNNQFSDDWKMQYNNERQQYEAAVFLKQGYYSYQYIVASPKKVEGILPTATFKTEGDFYNTHNEYQILVYQRHPLQRYDKLIGVTVLKN